jgi:deoxycytidylate deaminase
MKFQKLLQKLKKNSNHPVHQVSAVIAKKNQIISIGFNKYKTHTKSLHPWHYLHAEADAILKIKDLTKLKGSDIYIYREHRNGTPALSKPCESCFKMIKKYDIKNIFYIENYKFVKTST